MNRRLGAQESQILQGPFKQRQQQMGVLRSSVMKEKDEMRRREKERSDLQLHSSEEFDTPLSEWKQVMRMYEEDPTIHDAQITRTGDTVLHIAVSEGKEKVVAQMVESVRTQHPQNPKEVLEAKNERDNTPLHIAASMGNVKMCHLIASADPTLVDCRNVDGETPLFLAAFHGSKDAFLCLHFIRNPSSSPPPPSLDPPDYYTNCRRNDGDTILHCALNGDHFDVAFQIIHLYKNLVNSVNEDGLSPLHLLAAKPSAFRSGTRLGRIETIIYHGLYVQKLEVADPSRFGTAGKVQALIDQHYPSNYNTCFDIFSIIKSGFTNVLGYRSDEQHTEDTEKAKPKTNYTAAGGSEVEAQGDEFLPANYRTWYEFIKFLYVVVLIILGQGSHKLTKLRRKKEKHTWAVQILNALLQDASFYEYDANGSQPDSTPAGIDGSSPFSVKPSGDQILKDSGRWKTETPILIAAQNGVMEMVKKILELFPVAIHDMNEEKKNIVLLAVEKRQPHVYKFLLEKNIFKESLFRQVDNEGNSALHLAAKVGRHTPWLIAGAALQMQWEIKWFEFVKNSMPPQFFVRYNKNFETPKDIFTESHNELVMKGGEWLTKTSESCSVVATLVATVAFASSTTVPGGNAENGEPNLENEPSFDVFALSSLVALCFSVTSTVMFLSILTSRYQEFDFNKDLPRKLILGMSSLFMSIASMLVSFCAGHFFVLNHQLRYAALPIYMVTSFPVTLFALAQFPLYFDLLWATFTSVPKRSYKATPAMEYLPTKADQNIKDSKEKAD